MMNANNQKLPISVLERIDDLCAEFESAWRSQRPVGIEEMLSRAESSAERRTLLAELLVLEIDYRRRNSEVVEPDDYRARFADDVSLVDRAFEESAKRSTSGPFTAPSIESLRRLFPSLDLIELIGVGGMGAVYKARQKGLDRLVALKILPEELALDPKFALRFTREARALARLNHPHIVTVYEFDRVDDTYYFLMEYVHGSSLRSVIREGLLAPEQALSIVPHLCDALQFAHDQGVLHRDIKPENILLSHHGEVKIADFGLSRLLGNESGLETLTATHQVMGTPRYMAPEQLEGSHQVDHRADIYSLGVVIYEMLTGELPIGHFSAPSEKVQIDVRLDDVVMRTLAKEPGRRYQHASEIKSDVELITSDANHLRTPDLCVTETQGVGQQPADDAHRDRYPGTEPAVERADVAGESELSKLQRQELTSRLLLLRRDLMSRVETSLKPLFWGQILQMLIGVCVIVLGVSSWAPNTDDPYRLVAGLILHAYGASLIVVAGIVCTRIKRIDYSGRVAVVEQGLGRIRSFYLTSGVWVGLAWWVLWIPIAIAVGFDRMAQPYTLVASLAICGTGLIVSVGLYLYFLRRKSESAVRWQNALAGESLRSAFVSIREIKDAGVE